MLSAESKILHCRSVKTILEVLEDEWESPLETPRPSTSSEGPSSNTSAPPVSLTAEHRRLQIGLSPLLSIGTDLSQKLLPNVNDPKLKREVCVRAGSGWKAVLGISTSSAPKLAQNSSLDLKQIDETGALLLACRDDIIKLWNDSAVQATLKKHDVRLEESPGLSVLLYQHPVVEA
jgi:hypothetical protein